MPTICANTDLPLNAAQSHFEMHTIKLGPWRHSQLLTHFTSQSFSIFNTPNFQPPLSNRILLLVLQRNFIKFAAHKDQGLLLASQSCMSNVVHTSCWENLQRICHYMWFTHFGGQIKDSICVVRCWKWCCVALKIPFEVSRNKVATEYRHNGGIARLSPPTVVIEGVDLSSQVVISWCCDT